jgi:hypothetical protein
MKRGGEKGRRWWGRRVKAIRGDESGLIYLTLTSFFDDLGDSKRKNALAVNNIPNGLMWKKGRSRMCRKHVLPNKLIYDNAKCR